MTLDIDYNGNLVAYGYSANLLVKERLLKKIKKERLAKAISSFGIKFNRNSKKEQLEQILARECRGRPEHAEDACKLLVVDAKLRGRGEGKNWVMSQLAHFGVPFKTSSKVTDLEVTLVKACFMGQLDSVPASVREKALAKIDADFERAERAAKVAYESKWRAFMLDSKNADALFELDRARFFKEWDFKPKENTIVLHRLCDRSKEQVFALLSSSSSSSAGHHCHLIQTLPSEHEYLCNLVIGAKDNAETVSQVCERVEQETKFAIAKIKRDREEKEAREAANEKRIEERRLELERRKLLAEKNYRDMVESVRSRAYDWDICGTWNIECPQAEDYRRTDETIELFECYELDAWYYEQTGYSRAEKPLGSGFTLEICEESRGSHTFWGKLDLGFLVGVVKFLGNDPRGVMSVQWAAREEGTGEMIYGDSHFGEFAFSMHGTKFEAWLTGAYGRMELAGDKMKERDDRNSRAYVPIKEEWGNYNDRQYEYERVSCWGGSGW